VPSLDDEQFEKYLRRFHPIAPEPRPTVRTRRRSLHLFTPAAWLAASAAILIVGAVLLHTRATRVAGSPVRDVTSVERLSPSEPLTIATANSWLRTAPSFESALDGLAFRAKSNPIPPTKQSAIAVLSQEKTQP
jgi:hypothetical protein